MKFKEREAMWVISKYGFASAVHHLDKPGWVLVRARDRGDLEKFCSVAQGCDVPGYSEEAIEENPSADYRFRMAVKDEDWAQLVQVLALGIDYPNFKNEVASVDPERAAIYGGVWSELMKIQYPESSDWMEKGQVDRREKLSSLYRRAADHLAATYKEYADPLCVPEEELGNTLDPPVLPEQANEGPVEILEERLVQQVAIGLFQQASGRPPERMKAAEQRARRAAELRLDDDDWVPED